VVELIGAPENHGLTHRDADIAVRLTKPGAGSFLARRIAMVECGVFARRGVDAAKLPWIGFDDTLSDLPEARWLAKRESEPIAARAADLETMYQAARAGIGRALLPVAIARRDNSLALVPVADLPPARELWLLVERQVRQTRRVSVTLGWVEAVARDAFG
jgi:DNA-binding transcriptional LysR family regulator